MATQTTARISCDQCTAAMINGVFCHETGCPNSRKVFWMDEWITPVKCGECGAVFMDEDGAAMCCTLFEDESDD